MRAHIVLLGVLIILTTSIKTKAAEEKIKRTTLGLNLLALPDRTLDISLNYNEKPGFTWQSNFGFMLNNPLQGKDYAIINYHLGYNEIFGSQENSGAYIAFGLQYNSRKSYFKNNIYMGAKIIEGYYNKRADFLKVSEANMSDPMHIKNNAELFTDMTVNGMFTAAMLEIGVSIMATKRMWFDVGFQRAFPLIVSNKDIINYQVMPGATSAIVFNTIDYYRYVLSVKFVLGKIKKEDDDDSM